MFQQSLNFEDFLFDVILLRFYILDLLMKSIDVFFFILYLFDKFVS